MNNRKADSTAQVPAPAAGFRRELRKIELQRKEEAEKNRSPWEKIRDWLRERRAKKLRKKLRTGRPVIRN